MNGRPQTIQNTTDEFVVNRNACKLCTPLGAALAFKGIEGALSLLHGSQGCATYIRRYLISHFREPIDIASSNFTEHSTVFGGGSNLHQALDNLQSQYHPSVIGVASTCLSETIGEDLPAMLRAWTKARDEAGVTELPAIVGVSTASYRGTHREGFQSTVRETVKALVATRLSLAEPPTTINILPGMASPADLRWLRSCSEAFGLTGTILPDYSETLDGGLWGDYQSIPPGGTSVAAIRGMGAALASLELGALPMAAGSAGSWLQEQGIPLHALDLPIGIRLTDQFLNNLAALSGQAIPAAYQSERARLADSYVDAHKYLAGLPVAVFGEEDFVVAMVSFLAETGCHPVLAASGGKSGLLEKRLPELLDPRLCAGLRITSGIDFLELEDQARQLGVAVAVGSSKGFKLARSLDIPLIRAGFPVHDRFGGGRLLHYGYAGAQEFHDRLVNAVLERRQTSDPIGYTYF